MTYGDDRTLQLLGQVLCRTKIAVRGIAQGCKPPYSVFGIRKDNSKLDEFQEVKVKPVISSAPDPKLSGWKLDYVTSGFTGGCRVTRYEAYGMWIPVC